MTLTGWLHSETYSTNCDVQTDMIRDLNKINFSHSNIDVHRCWGYPTAETAQTLANFPKILLVSYTIWNNVLDLPRLNNNIFPSLLVLLMSKQSCSPKLSEQVLLQLSSNKWPFCTVGGVLSSERSRTFGMDQLGHFGRLPFGAKMFASATHLETCSLSVNEFLMWRF